MPFEVTVESDKLLGQFTDVQTRISDLENKLPEVFLEWQSEDMKRKYPTVDKSGLSVATSIYPRSRRKRVNTGSKGRATTNSPRRRILRMANRPILRPILVKQLFDRMVQMCREALAWR